MKRVLLLALFVALVGLWGLWYWGGEAPAEVGFAPILGLPIAPATSGVIWAPKDANQDGVFDWEEELLAPAGEEGQEKIAEEDKNAIAAVRFALETKRAPLIPAEAAVLAPTTRYKLDQIRTVESDNPLVLSAYVEDLREIMSVFSNPGVGYEISLTNQAVELGTASGINQIAALSTRYHDAAEKLLALEAPAASAQIHLNLINALTQLGAGAALMSQVETEPVAALTAAQTHGSKLRYFIAAINNVNIFFLPQAVAYGKNNQVSVTFDL